MTIADIGSLGTPPAPYDLCVVGGGAVGLTLAAALAPTGLRVLVLEGGALKRSRLGQEPFRGEVVDPMRHSPLHHFRVRALGGSSQIWGGRCLPFDPIDFEQRDWVSLPGWPIRYDELLPYYKQANDAAEAGRFDYDPGRPLIPGLDGVMLQTTLERFSRPTDFSRRYQQTLSGASNIDVMLNATVAAVRLRPQGDSVDHLEVVAPGGRRFQIRANGYVLAAGGLETTRLLLASNDVQPAGVGNTSGWLGRCYMCHMSATVGTATFSGPATAIAGDYERDADEVYVRRRIAITPYGQRRLKILNLAFRLHLPEIADPTHGDPVLSSLYLARLYANYEYRRRLRDSHLPRAHQARHLRNVVRHPIRLSRFMAHLLVNRYLSNRRLPSVVMFSPDNQYPMEFHSEQAPNPQSRVTLIHDRDAFGVPRLRVDWRPSQLDFDTIRTSYRVLASELDRTGTGRLSFNEETLEEQVLSHGAFGGHHLGTARMSAHASDGVVDPYCRVHGIDNLFVVGSAVMPTSSQANPTLTALALALRLADHLKDYGKGKLIQYAPERSTILGGSP